VVENAGLDNGLLNVGLRRVVPEALKPRKIAIAVGQDVQKVISAEAEPTAQAA
jgi:molecular chaperone IbpA